MTLLDSQTDDPGGAITCTCGEVFSGANFAERLVAWQQHLEAEHGAV